MKNRIIVVVLCLASLLLCSCDSNNESSENENSKKLSEETTTISSSIASEIDESKKETTPQESKTIIVENSSVKETELTTTTTTVITERQSHREYVHNYSAYAEKGAIVTYCDPKTGETKYKVKCESCGWVSSGEQATCGSLSSTFGCGNVACSLWGKTQHFKIVCEDNGEWVEVYD